jgi:DNA-binding NarL/FixJ family response regulator
METISVAIADDHLLFCKGLVNIINSFSGMEVILEAENGKHLVDQLAVCKNKPDVILMDLKMPVMGGIEASKIIQELHPDIKIIVLSMFDEDQYILNMMSSGVNGYLLKDTEPEELAKAIKMVFTSGYYFSEHVIQVMHKGLINKAHSLPETDAPAVNFSDRERQILELICNENTTKEIADKIFLSPRTIEGYRKSMLEKTGTKNTAGLVIFAIKNHLIDLPLFT